MVSSRVPLKVPGESCCSEELLDEASSLWDDASVTQCVDVSMGVSVLSGSVRCEPTVQTSAGADFHL